MRRIRIIVLSLLSTVTLAACIPSNNNPIIHNIITEEAPPASDHTVCMEEPYGTPDAPCSTEASQ